MPSPEELKHIADAHDEMTADRHFLVKSIEAARDELDDSGGHDSALAEHINTLHAQLLALDAKLLADANALDELYASATGPGEAYDNDLLALVSAAHAVVGCTSEHRAMAIAALDAALQAFEPWLEQDEDPRSMGWVDDRGRP